MSWQKGKSRKRHNAGKKAYRTRMRREGYRDVTKGVAGVFMPPIGMLLSLRQIGRGAGKILFKK